MRVLKLTPGYVRSARRLRAHGPGDRRRKVAATIRELLAAQDLPLQGDDEAIIPPVLHCHVRRVPGSALWLWYTFSDEFLVVRFLADKAP